MEGSAAQNGRLQPQEQRHSENDPRPDLSSAAVANRMAEDNALQTLFRMAVTAILALLIASRALFIPSARGTLCEGKAAEGRKMSEKRRSKSGVTRGGEGDTSSSEEEEEEGEKGGREKLALKIDSELLHTDTMPREERETGGGGGSVPESPPIQIETIGVRKDHLREQMMAQGAQPAAAPPPFLFFPMGADEEEAEAGATFGRLDAISEEDSDELRSAQSSRASTARAHRRSQEEAQPKVVELSAPEEQEAEQTRVPRLDLSSAQSGGEESSADERTQREEASSPSETDTVLVKEEEEEEKEIPVQMFHPADADRDQSEVVDVMADQQIETTMEEGRVSSPSMSINLDRSRDSLLDQSLCSNPRDESTAAAAMMDTRQRRLQQTAEAEEEQTPRLRDQRQTAVPTTMSATTGAQRKQSEKASSTSSSAYGGAEEEEEAMPAPPPPVVPKSAELTAEKQQPYVPPKPSVTPLWGRNERLVGYLHGYGTLGMAPGEREGKENIIGNGHSRKRLEEEDDGDGWTVHPIALREDYGTRRGRERRSPVAARERSSDWTRGTYSPHNGFYAGTAMADLPPPFSSSGATKSTPFDFSRDSTTAEDVVPPPAGFMRTDRLLRPQGIREIPIQRSASAFAPMFGHTAVAPATRGTTTATTAPNEYYRREVLTRTLVTRSSEALSAPPPLSRSSPIGAPLLSLDAPRDEVSEEYWIRYSRNIEEEERRIREAQERRRKDEEERRRRIEEQRRRWEQQEMEQLERVRRERERVEKELEAQLLDRERAERERVFRDREEREAAEKRRREEWERIERERRQYEEAELEKRRELERLERERLERERAEAERAERERLEALRREQERLEQQRLEQERIERERIEIERLEIERIERIRREQREKEDRERERQRQEAERLMREREELERLERERLELERQALELLERERREEEERERERREEALREAKRRDDERREREALERAEREAMEREAARRARERAELERLEALRREQERLEQEQLEAERRERERQEEERRERELLEASIRAKERREQERLDELERERQRQEEERKEHERRQRERLEAQERERLRQLEEQRERDRLAALEAAAAERRALRAREGARERERMELERRAEELRDMERREQERRERERAEEERRLAELRELEQRNAELRDRERKEAQEREEQRRKEGWRSRDKLEQLARERDERERCEAEKRRLLAAYEQDLRKRQALTSKETLERLTRKPYYSRENLSVLGTGPAQPEVTTKVERQVIERVDRTLWSEPVPPVPYSSSYGNGILPSLLDERRAEELGRERIYNPQDFLRRGGSTRTSKYKSRTEKARKEFLQGEPPAGDSGLDRFRKSTEELTRRVEYRGPLLQRFNSGEFAHPSEQPMAPYPSGLGRSPYEQEFERLLAKARRQLAHYYRRAQRLGGGRSDAGPLLRVVEHSSDALLLGEEHRRSRSVLDYSPRQSRRDVTEMDAGTQHSRSKSADYLTDPRRPRDEQHIPENDLQKSIVGLPAAPAPPLGEHELRFRKSTERIHVPDWYRDYAPSHVSAAAARLSPMTATSGVYSAANSGGPFARPGDLYSAGQRPWTYVPPASHSLTPGSPPVGGISFPAGMFDRYKDEIEDLRRSRTSLHQLGQQAPEHTKAPSEPSLLGERTVRREYCREAFSKTEVSSSPLTAGQHLPGYTVSTVPNDWRLARDRAHSRVVEVADTFVDKPQLVPDAAISQRYGGRITIEEALDAILQSTSPVEAPPPADPGFEAGGREGLKNAGFRVPEQELQSQNADGLGIFTPNQTLMDRVAEQPHLAETLLKNEPLFVRCAHCRLVRPMRDARVQYCWCRHCYTYYCSRQCRQRDWERHRDRCTFARINSLCKEVIMKVRRDPETQYHMSRVAREGYRREGRGSVNIRLISAHSALLYLSRGWSVFAQHDPNQLLFYYPVQALVDQRKEPSLIQLCRKYNPNEKFILSVSIIADIEHCPETPPPAEPGRSQQPQGGETAFVYSTAVPTNV